jgi:CheY-like chemotaxis protein
MPGIDGFQATAIIRQYEVEKDLPPATIAAVTAHAMPEHYKRARQSGMNEFLLKPIAHEDVEKIVRLAYAFYYSETY